MNQNQQHQEVFLSDAQCDEFRVIPGSFNHMVRTIYAAGAGSVKAEAMALSEDFEEIHNLLGPEECNNCDLAGEKLSELEQKIDSIGQKGNLASIDRDALSQLWNMFSAVCAGDLGSALAAGQKAEEIIRMKNKSPDSVES